MTEPPPPHAGPATHAGPTATTVGERHDLGPEPVEESPARPGASRRRTRAVVGWAVAFAVCFAAFGLPTDPAYAFLWLWALSVAWRIDLPWRAHLEFARDWVPVVILLSLYNLSRGFADDFVLPHVTEMIHADTWMFGWATGGLVPTAWLQQHLYDPTRVHWWEVPVAIVYFSHFVATLGAAVTLWLTSRPLWAAFMRRWFLLSLSGLVTYFIYPAAPPWWASKFGYLTEPVSRISLRGGEEVGLHGAFSIVRLGQAAANPVAAIPSLHTAFALFVVLFFATRVRRRFWPLLALYPLAMTFTLVYSGEHYVIDVLVGWAYVGLVFLVVGLGERWWRSRRSPDAGSGTAESGTAESGTAESGHRRVNSLSTPE